MNELEKKAFLELKTTLKNAEKEIHQLFLEKEKLAVILESIGDGIFVIDVNLNIILINQVALDIAQIDKDKAVGVFYQNALHFEYEDSGLLNDSFIKNTISLRKTQKMSNKSVLVKKDGTKIPVADSSSPLFNAGGEVIGVVVIFRDITEERALDKAKSGFISIASHQLRTPLTAIRWYSEMLVKDSEKFDETQKDFLNEIHQGSERLYETINLLLSISRIESDQAKAPAIPVDLYELTNQIYFEVRSLIDEKKINFSVTKIESKFIVTLDPVAFRQVVSNLFTNAIRYTGYGGKIEVSWKMNDEKTSVIYSVRDNGIGIPENQKEHIFTKFFRAQNAIQKVPDGSGLGLSLVKELVELWGGNVYFEGMEGKGTTFFFTIPVNTEA